MVRRNAAEVLTGLVVLIVAVGFLGYAIAHSGQTSVSGGYPLYARFSSIAGLNNGADVRLAGVKIGVVEGASIDPKTYLANVRMMIEQGIALPKDSSITVSSESLLGGEYLSVQPGASETMLQPGQTVQYHPGCHQPGRSARQVYFQRHQYGKRHDRQRAKGKCRWQLGTIHARDRAAEAMIPPAPQTWPQPDGTPLSCREKLKMLAENHAEVSQTLQDVFEDAVLMGVDERAMRQLLLAMVEGLESPKRD